jgi:anti-sigma regulatory factor (Ser/Thr protein kinase)
VKPAEVSADFRLLGGLSPATLDQVQHRASLLMDEAHVPAVQRHALSVLVEEICTNILEHSQASWMELGIRCDGHAVTLAFADDGQPFDPQEALGSPQSLERPAHRNLGLYMVRSLAENVRYFRDALGVNVIELDLNPAP